MSGGARAAQVRVLVETRSLDGALDYAVPGGLDARAVPGALVACPLGARRVLGVVVSREPPTHPGRLASVLGAVDLPPVPADLMQLALWTASYYRAPVASCLRLALPPGADGALRKRDDGTWELRGPSEGRSRLVATAGAPGPATDRQRQILAALADAGGSLPAAELCRAAGTSMQTLHRMAEAGTLVVAEERALASGLDWFAEDPPGAEAASPELVPEQAEAISRITSAIGGGEALLLHGVTGSGKTEVYLQAIAAARSRGLSSILLVPEIGLTPQTLRRVRARLGDGVSVWHSGLTATERAAEYRRIRSGEADVVVGARSAVFAPAPALGLVIVDEEHDGSYKQDASPRYDARRVAYERGRLARAAVVYGSATPRVETWHALEHVTLPTRVDGSRLPRIEVIDMRTQRAGPLSRPLERALQHAGERGEKAIVLLNRRGFALMALCRSCGWIARCPQCDVALVHHRERGRLSCHHCGHDEAPRAVCPSCRAADIARQGAGTESLEHAIAAAAPRSRLVRMDATTASGRGAVGRLLDEFARPGPAVLVGTQMVAKGHDLPDVTVAGVVGADAGLQRPDFRSEERTFSLIVQLAGRAGRRGEPARVIVQAYEPEERVVRLAGGHRVSDFLSGELQRRQARGYPPFSHLVRMLIEGEDRQGVIELAAAVGERVRRDHPDLSLLGPAPLHRLRGRTRRALLARAGRAGTAADALEAAAGQVAAGAGRRRFRIVIDVDPQDT
ncbi:MAG: primosomal protein N' [Thermoleophilia bacterium]|nr:primosomal protein N' [Thermoleophilia bacterium]